MPQKYEYKFVRLESNRNWLIGSIPAPSAKDGYQAIVYEHAEAGWRLVQVFAPGIGAYGMAAYFELIFERELPCGAA